MKILCNLYHILYLKQIEDMPKQPQVKTNKKKLMPMEEAKGYIYISADSCRPA